jgi:thiamine-monophosphate kinase
VTVSITAIGSVPQGRMVRRGTGRPGDVLFVSGTLGDAALGLALRNDASLGGVWGLAADEAAHLRRRYLRPEPRLALAEALREHASAAMDISDGLAKDLDRLCRASGCGGRVGLAELPLSPAAAKAVAADPALALTVASGGDDYEILAAVAPAQASDFVAAASRAGIPVTRIGTLTDGSTVRIEAADRQAVALPSAGWDHF